MAETATCYRHPDRETGLSCSECGRPICVDCMTVAPVGIRCPEHATKAGKAPAPARVQARRQVRMTRARVGTSMVVTKALIAVNVAIYLITVAQGGGINDPGGALFNRWALYGPLVADGDWWRLITAAFLHGGIFHIALNMLALWWIGGPLEEAVGPWRYLGIYVVSGLAGSAGALLLDPNAVTVGASGAIFGLLGAMVVLQWQHTGSIAGPALTIILLNLVITFTMPNISIGGHLGGALGGVLATLALTRFGTRHAAYGRVGVTGAVSLAAIGVASVAIAYLKVRGLA